MLWAIGVLLALYFFVSVYSIIIGNIFFLFLCIWDMHVPCSWWPKSSILIHLSRLGSSWTDGRYTKWPGLCHFFLWRWGFIVCMIEYEVTHSMTDLDFPFGWFSIWRQLELWDPNFMNKSEVGLGGTLGRVLSDQWRLDQGSASRHLATAWAISLNSLCMDSIDSSGVCWL